jgi:hypothetical protein
MKPLLSPLAASVLTAQRGRQRCCRIRQMSEGRRRACEEVAAQLQVPQRSE